MKQEKKERSANPFKRKRTFCKYKKDENVHRYAVRGGRQLNFWREREKESQKERKRVRQTEKERVRERERERERERNKQIERDRDIEREKKKQVLEILRI